MSLNAARAALGKTVILSEPPAEDAVLALASEAPGVARVLPDIERRHSRWASRSVPMAGDV